MTKDEYYLLACEHVIGLARPEDLVAGASALLEAGVFTESLGLLGSDSGVDADQDRRWFELSIEELEFEIPSLVVAVTTYVAHLVSDLLHGKISSSECAQLIGQRVYFNTEYQDLTTNDPCEISEFGNLDDEYGWRKDTDAVDVEVRDYARRWLAWFDAGMKGKP